MIGDRKRSPRGCGEVWSIGLATDAAVDELMRRAQDAAPRSSSKPETHGDTPGAFADPDGHMWQVGRADGFLTR